MTAEMLAATPAKLAADRAAPVLVAIDGRSGSGKSTLAASVAELLGASIVSADDFFAASLSDSDWSARTPAERAADCLDWRRLRGDALEPLTAGRPAAWHALDFAAGTRPDGSYALQTALTTCAATPIVLVDGAYSARPELADLMGFTVLVEADADVRAERLVRREAAAFLSAWQARWGAAEDHYFELVRPRSTFDLVIDGT